MTPLICPQCGRLYGRAPKNAVCEDCDLVNVVAVNEAADRGLASAKLHQRGLRVRNILVVAGMAIGLATGMLTGFTVGGFAIVLALFLPIATGAVAWGAGVMVWERRVGLWSQRSTLARALVALVTVTGVGGVVVGAAAYAIALDEQTRKQRTQWEPGLTFRASRLDRCFSDGSSGPFQMRWQNENVEIVVVSSFATETTNCLIETAGEWHAPPLADGESVTCDYTADRRILDEGERLVVERLREPFVGLRPCQWIPPLPPRKTRR